MSARGVAATQLDRDVLVGVAVHEQHLGARRIVDRRRRALLEQALDGARARAELGGQAEIADGCLREHAAHAQPARGEQGEVPAGAVAGDRHAPGVDFGRQGGRRRDDVLERRRPVAAAIDASFVAVAFTWLCVKR